MRIATAEDNNYLTELLNFIHQGEEVLIIHQGSPVAMLSPVVIKAISENLGQPKTDISPAVKPRKRRPGTAKGLVMIHDNFDEPLEEFKGYM